jgi:hypothetical protein
MALDPRCPEGAAMKQVRRINMKYVDTDGKIEQRPTTIYLDLDKFAIAVPEHVQEALGAGRYVHDEIQSKCVEKYERKMTEFEAWFVAAKAEPVLILYARLRSIDRRSSARRSADRYDVDRDSFFLQNDGDDAEQHVAVQFAYRHGFRVVGRIYRREEERRDMGDKSPPRFKVGRLDHRLGADEVVLDHTPELEAQIERVCEALDGATRTLSKILAAKDVGAALLAMTVPRLPAPPPVIEKPKGRGRR